MDELYRFFNDKEQMIAMVMCKEWANEHDESYIRI